MKSIETKQVVVTEVQVGDVFQFVKESGCRTVGELLVVKKAWSSGNVDFVAAHPVSGSYGSLNFLSEELTAGNLVYVGTVTINSLEIK